VYMMFPSSKSRASSAACRKVEPGTPGEVMKGEIGGSVQVLRELEPWLYGTRLDGSWTVWREPAGFFSRSPERVQWSLITGSVARAQQGEHVQQDEGRERRACSCPSCLVPRVHLSHPTPAVFAAQRCARNVADMSYPVISYVASSRWRGEYGMGTQLPSR
jgi:hypothetical protein